MCARIVVIEDDTGIRDMISSVLADEGHRVMALAQPPNGSQAVAELAPDLLVVDLLFGRIPAGIELIRTLRQDPRTATVPIVLCTAAWRMADPLRPELSALSVTLVTKPFDIEELIGLVGDLIEV